MILPENNQKWILFINLTKKCNIDCPRCYIKEKHRKQNGILPLETYKAFIDSHLFKSSKITIIYQGGEPTTLGMPKFKEYVEVTQEILPNVSQTMVTNCIGAKDWHVELAQEYFNSTIETTYALGHKQLLTGSEEKYQDLFFKGLRYYSDNNVHCTVNVELNRETFLAGAENLIEVFRDYSSIPLEFDFSIDFRKYFDAPSFLGNGRPILPLTIDYKDVAFFLNHLISLGIKNPSKTLDTFSKNSSSEAFNVQCENKFLTLNPSGEVTTNPLYSDIPVTYIGNINNTLLDNILMNKNRLSRIQDDANRVLQCVSCEKVKHCRGGPSHLPLFDSNGDCSGLKPLYLKLA